ncbi:YtxH domain-containing protein [Candidatus Peregrinibacteria bacterium]|nr:YtxH domain-containing protein [Candidatus Peregrinibacteria bacterium]
MKLWKYVVGLVSGLTFGMLFAPRKGSELRGAIMKKANKDGHTEGLKILGDAFMDAGGDAWAEMKKLSEHEQVEAFLELSKEKLHEYLATVEERGYDVAGVAQQKLQEIAELATRKANEFKTKLEKGAVPAKKKPATRKPRKKTSERQQS